MKYNKKINQYYKKSQNFGSFSSDTNNVGTGLVGAPACGDVMQLQIQVEKDVIQKAKLLVFGCGSAKASSTLAVEMLIGKTLNEALQIKDEDIAKALDLPKIKMHCSVLAESAIKRAVEDYKKQQSENNFKLDSDNTKELEKKIKNVAKEKKFNIQVSKAAVSFIKNILLKKNNPDVIGVSINLIEEKCGLKYQIKEIKKTSTLDNFLCITRNGLQIFINKDIEHLVNGTKMDYKVDGLKTGIVFYNPNEKSKCGCGANFKI